MKIADLLTLTQTEPLANIANKKRLGISKDTARDALKKAGCYNINGKRGWYCDDESVLERSIFDFVEKNRVSRKQAVTSAEKEVSATVEKRPRRNTTSQLSNKTTNKQISKQSNNPKSKPVMKKVTYEIEEQLHDELKIKSIREKRTVSEIVNEIIKRGI